MPVCSECGEDVFANDQRGMVSGYAYAEDQDGTRIKDSEAGLGHYHRDCWERWKEKHQPPAARPPSSSRPSVEAEAGDEPENDGADLKRRWHAEMVEAEAGDDPGDEDADPGLA